MFRSHGSYPEVPIAERYRRGQSQLLREHSGHIMHLVHRWRPSMTMYDSVSGYFLVI